MNIARQTTLTALQPNRIPKIPKFTRLLRRLVKMAVPSPPCWSQSKIKMRFSGYCFATNARPLKVQYAAPDS